MEHQIFRFAEMILPERCSPSYGLASLFPGRRSSLAGGLETSQNALGTLPSVCMQLSIFEGSLAELLRF